MKFERDWFNKVSMGPKPRRKLEFEIADVTSLDQLPTFISAKQAGEKLNQSPKTIAHWMAIGLLKSIKIRGRRFTTPEFIADFLNEEIRRHG